jgi:opacity protein-like surface antigen
MMLLLVPDTASADITAFLGATPSPVNRGLTGAAVGFGLIIVGAEAEVSRWPAVSTADTAALTTWSANGLLQTPGGISPVQLYATAGAGLYRETTGTTSRMSTALNTGGGVKVKVAGPIRLRLDYRLFRLQGTPQTAVLHRIYGGATLAF